MVAGLTLGMAIGVNAVVFSAMNGLILRPPNLSRFEGLYIVDYGSDKDSSEFYPDYELYEPETR
jgi:hypothetical protein